MILSFYGEFKYEKMKKYHAREGIWTLEPEAVSFITFAIIKEIASEQSMYSTFIRL